MHEIGLCESIMVAVEQRAAGRRVSGVCVRVGTLQRVWKPAFEQAFALVSTGTVAAGATVELVIVPVRSTCRDCGQTAESDEVPLACAACGGTELELAGGDELMLESIRVQREPATAG